MDINESERVVIAKPVASKPTCSNFRSFSELLAGAVNASPPNVCSETAVPAIRPKTVRFKPMVNRAPAASISSQAEPSGSAPSYSSDKDSKSGNRSSVVYKPQAKLVSKTTVSLLANMGNFNTSQLQELPSAEVQHPNEDKLNFSTQVKLSPHEKITTQAEVDYATESSRSACQNQVEDPKNLLPLANGDRPSYDGYNWRKYGQKQVKGSEYPRSYYKCTHPNCPVKKKVERSLDGQIAEIVYKGEHNHPKPQPPKRNSSGLGSDVTGTDANTSLWSSNPSERNEGSDGKVENQNEIGLPAHATYKGKVLPTYEPTAAGSVSAGAGTSDNSCGLSAECDEGSKLEADDDEPASKRRKSENQSTETGVSEDVGQDPRVVVQSSPDSEIFGDGFRWRKYGQKVVKGNAYPRSYYRCTNLKCNVRKHVERVSDDPRAFITTYEGKHNHEMPLRSATPAATEPDSETPSSKDKP